MVSLSWKRTVVIEWHKSRTFSAKGETYHAKFSVNADGDEYITELGEATWRTLKVGKRDRLKVGLLSDEVLQVSPASDGTHR